MEIKKTVKAPNRYIFDKIINSGLYDVKKQTGREISAAQLAGFEYKKVFGKNQSGRIKFDEVIVPSVYAFSTFTIRQTFQTRWDLKEIDSDTTEVTISESQISSGFFQRLNDMAVGFLLGRAKRKQIIAVLEEMERDYKG